MSKWLDGPLLVGLPKVVVYLPDFSFHREMEDDKKKRIVILQNAIESNSPIESKFYRNGYDRQDDVYDDTGMLHLHLGGDDLLMIVQYDDKVVFVCTASHDIFDERPKAQSVKLRYGGALAKQDITPAPAFIPQVKTVEVKKKKNHAALKAAFDARNAKSKNKDEKDQ